MTIVSLFPDTATPPVERRHEAAQPVEETWDFVGGTDDSPLTASAHLTVATETVPTEPVPAPVPVPIPAPTIAAGEVKKEEEEKREELEEDKEEEKTEERQEVEEEEAAEGPSIPSPFASYIAVEHDPEEEKNVSTEKSVERSDSGGDSAKQLEKDGKEEDAAVAGGDGEANVADLTVSAPHDEQPGQVTQKQESLQGEEVDAIAAAIVAPVVVVPGQVTEATAGLVSASAAPASVPTAPTPLARVRQQPRKSALQTALAGPDRLLDASGKAVLGCFSREPRHKLVVPLLVAVFATGLVLGMGCGGDTPLSVGVLFCVLCSAF